jgi:hypothetical protein
VRRSAYRAAITAFGLLLATLARPVAAGPQLFDITFRSSQLSQFFRQPVDIGASVLLPPSYYKEPNRRYPVIYVVPAFEGTDVVTRDTELEWQRPMQSVRTEFIIVILH